MNIQMTEKVTVVVTLEDTAEVLKSIALKVSAVALKPIWNPTCTKLVLNFPDHQTAQNWLNNNVYNIPRSTAPNSAMAAPYSGVSSLAAQIAAVENTPSDR